jgi:Arc/MetJ family transcription regulator
MELAAMTKVQINLPDQLAQEAQNAGLLTPERLERMLREQLKTRKTDELFTAMDRMAAVNEPAMTPEEIAEELHAMRAARRPSR